MVSRGKMRKLKERVSNSAPHVLLVNLKKEKKEVVPRNGWEWGGWGGGDPSFWVTVYPSFRGLVLPSVKWVLSACPGLSLTSRVRGEGGTCPPVLVPFAKAWHRQEESEGGWRVLPMSLSVFSHYDDLRHRLLQCPGRLQEGQP